MTYIQFVIKTSLICLSIFFLFIQCPGGSKNPFLFFTSADPVVHGIVIKEASHEYPSGANFGFGNVVHETQGDPISFQLVNQGSSTVILGETSITGTHLNQFLIIDAPGNGLSMDPGDTISFEIRFSPDINLGVKNAILTIQSNDPNVGNYSLKLTGTSVLAPAPRIEVKIGSISLNDNSAGSTQYFSAQENTTSAAKTYTIKNTGNLDLTLNTLIDLSGTGSSYFSVTQPSKSVLAPNGSTTFTIRFNPTDTNPRNATVQIYTNDPNISTFRILVSGTGTPEPSPKIDVIFTNNSSMSENATSGTSHIYNFGSLFPDGSTRSSFVIIKNIGDIGTTLHLSSITVDDTTNFTVTNLGVSNLLKTDSYDPYTIIQVSFKPSSLGVNSATLTINSSNGSSGDASTSTITYNGTGGKRDLLIVWSNSKEKGVQKTGGGYKLCYKKSSTFSSEIEDGVNCQTIPYVSGPYAPNSQTVTVNSVGQYYFRIKSFSELNSNAPFSAPLSTTVSTPSP